MQSQALPVEARRRLKSLPLLARAAAAAVIAVGVWSLPATAQQSNLSASDRAAMTLTTAKSAFNDQNYEVAADRFREYLKSGAGNRVEIAAARYGLGVCLIDGPAKDYKTAAEVLAYAATTPTFADRGYAAWYLGVAQRGLAEQIQAAAATQPTKAAAGARRAGDQQLMYAATNFGLAAEALTAAAPASPTDDKELAPAWQWVARAKCDEADALLRIGQLKQAAAAASAVLDDPRMSKSRYRDQAAYDHGYASFGLKDYGTAVRSLSSLAPFDQGDVGVHARFLLGRVHHLAGERPEAITDYQGLVAAWEKQRADAQAKLADPALKPQDKERLAAVAKAPAPDHVARAMFYWGVALQEFGTADEAVTKFMAAVQLAPQSPVAAEARLRAAQAGVQVRKFREALAAVTPLADDPQHGDQALRFMAKAQYGIGTIPVPKGTSVTAVMNAVPDPALLAAGIKQAVATLQKADERIAAVAAAAAPRDAQVAANARRATILLELGDMLQLDGQYREAAVAYQSAAAPQSAPADVAEQAQARQAIALQLAGDYAAADKVCRLFTERFTRSALRGEVTLRYAENALLAAHAAKDPGAANADGSKRPYGEALVRFNRVIEKFPETPQANLARMGLATIHYLQGQYAEAANLLSKIPDGDRVDDLVGVNFLLADCQLRALPDEVPDDALGGARLVAQLEQVTAQLEGYVAGNPNDPATPDALLRVGYASNKLAAMFADPVEKRRVQGKARRAYAVIVQQFPGHPLYPVAMLENAKMLVQMSGATPAVMELSKFQVAPLDKTPIAPLALIHLADAQRLRRKPDDAVSLLTAVRGQYEADLLKDPQRAEWVPALQYSLALSYKEAGEYDDARALFQKIAKDFPKRPEAGEVAWRIAQCLTDPAMIEVEQGRRAFAAAARPAMQDELFATLLESTKRLRAAAEQMQQQAEALAAKADESDLPQKMNNDAAWCWKVVGEVEVEAAKRTMQAQAVKRIADKLAAEEPGRAVGAIRPPEILPTAIPMQPGEKLARKAFKAVVDAGGESPLVAEARLELAELYGQRSETELAIATLKEAVGQNPTADLAERLKIRLATLHLNAGDAKSAAALANEVLNGQRTSYPGYARVIAVEAAYQQKDWAGTVEAARPFLESPKGIGRSAGVSDLALLRMADAQGHMGQWKEAKETLDACLARFPGGGGYYTYETKYAYGWVNENLKDLDAAAMAYGDVAARVGGELGAKANLQLGRMRLAQNKPAEALSPLLTVAYAYEDADLNPAALCEAARALIALEKPADAKRMLERAIKEYPTGQWAAAAKKQLAEIK